MAFEEILAWSAQEGRPAWQQDGLRRIAVSGELIDDDLAALGKIIEKEVGLIDEEIDAGQPLSAEHLSEAVVDAPRTILGSIGPVRRVDRLAEDQPPIRFAKRGISLVYGANASGKSGYCRIAKQLCRSLSPKDLKGNVYDVTPAGPPEVELVFGVEGSEPSRREITWRPTDPSPRELARISVFDTDSARVYVDKNRRVEFLPYELDLLNKLALLAKALDSGFEARQSQLARAVMTPLPAGFSGNTTVSQVLVKLSPDTSETDLPSEAQLRNLGEWSEEKDARLQSVVREINSDPAVQIGAIKITKQTLESIKVELSTNATLLGAEGIRSLVSRHADKVTKIQAAEAAARGIGEGMPISEIGSETWRQMLMYAREFAGEVFPDRSEPKLATAESCVLCQQSLDGDASYRMAEFDRYISGRAATESVEATEAFDALVQQITALNIKTSGQVEELLAAYSETTEERKTLAGEISAEFGVLSARLEVIKSMIEEDNFEEVERLSPLQADLVQKISNDLVNLQGRIEDLERASTDGERIKQLLDEKAELEDTKRLSQVIDLIVERQKQLSELLKVKEARKQCASSPIARQITSRRRALLTDSLKSQLRSELQALRLSHIPIDLSDRSSGADSIVEIGLTAQQRIKSNSDVLSEGEQRALALSCFLAELKEVGAEHGIIVDDPVSSLDHSRMEAVAKRLVAEAASGRQVIIFTHNIVFHYMVESEARREGLPLHAEWMLSTGSTKFGIINESGQPPHQKKTNQRINEIEEAKSRLFKGGYDPGQPDQFRDGVTAIYTRMRETWERIVEEIIFNGAIQRFRPEIMTQSLKHAAFNPEEDYPAIFEGMKRCSHYSGHDRAEGLPDELPDQGTIESDLAALKEFRDVVVARKKALERVPSYEAGISPEFL
ncbi:AAA family ATPase [Nisaea sp.]|uniref:AAA family ATPase n=1 Tax=Nisaea sp. TaxID=2024842 RepID=UPI003B51BBCC